jgi:transcriptional regulator with XRE-family HTH domain
MVDDEASRSVRLREHRLRMGLTQHDVAVRLEQLAWSEERRRVGVNADMVSKWERGLKHPSAFYARLLCALFGTTASELGVGTSPPPTPVPAVSQDPVVDDSDGLIGALEVLDGSLTNAELVIPRLVGLWRNDVLSRRQLLGTIGVAPVVAAFGTDLGSGVPEIVVRQATSPAVEDLARILAHLEASYHSLDARALLLPLRAVIETVQDYLAGTTTRRDRTDLLAALARANLLAGRLCFFDVNRSFEARAHFDLAREAAEQADDPVLGAVVLGHMAFLPVAKHNFSSADRYLETARGALGSGRSHLVSSWLYAVASEVHARAGNVRAALRSIESASKEIGASATPPPTWFDFYDQRRLAGFEGFAMRQANRFEDARASLEGLIGDGVGLSSKQVAVTLVDLADVHVAAGDLDEGCRLATSAADELRRATYATGVARLLQFRRALPDRRHAAVRLLEDRISELH